jgi:nitrate reductase gamma subunit
MQYWLDFARGPLFLFAFSFMVLGLFRHLLITSWQIFAAMRRAGDKSLPYKKILVSTLKWLFPLGKIREQPLFSLTSILFHAAVIIVPIFLAGHIALWESGFGISWPAISNQTADILTLIAIVSAVALVLQRAAAKATRSLSRFQDYALPLLIAAPFLSGYLMTHPASNPFPYDATFLVHLLSATLVFILIPLTKLSHMILLPEVQLVSEVAWHWPEDAGSRVAATLGKENAPI